MARTVKRPEVRRQELIDIALKQFIENGYEKTSVRSILKEAGGEIGMFYHYFDSKNTIYEAALDRFIDLYAERMEKILTDEHLSYQEKLDRFLLELARSTEHFEGQNIAGGNPDFKLVIQGRSLDRLSPIFTRLIFDEEDYSNIAREIAIVCRFLLYGVSGVLHTTEIERMEERVEQAKSLLYSNLRNMGI